jgi:hypothetical protein
VLLTALSLAAGCGGSRTGGLDASADTSEAPADALISPDTDVTAVDAPGPALDAQQMTQTIPVDAACGAPDDPRNCGTCGNDCFALPRVRAGAATVECRAGQCVIPASACQPGWAHCTGEVREGCETPVLQVDACGGCDVKCGVDEACLLPQGEQTARCVLHCQGPRPDMCGGKCTNLKTSAENCGACGKACVVAHGEGRCVDGECEVASCRPGFGDCTAQEPGCETALQMNHSNCGACGNSCAVLNGNATCVAGTCGPVTCQAGFADCDKARPDCESALNSELNCGGCGQRCLGQTPFCLTYQGKQQCLAGCLAPAPDRCGSLCVDHATDTFNCGTCGKICSYSHAGATCSAGACVMGACHAGYADCNKEPSDGCETALDTNRDCGACGRACATPNATSICMAGTCSAPECLPGWADCNSAVAGCETSLGSSEHCGVCGKRCMGDTPLCSVASGAAQCVAGCPALMPVRCGDTCVDITSNVQHCGGCNNACTALDPNARFICSGASCHLDDCLPGFVKDAGKCVACTPRKAMVCGRGPNGIYCGVANGQGGFSNPGYWDITFSDGNGWAGYDDIYGTIQFPDLNGDGRGDVCGRGFLGVVCAEAKGLAYPGGWWWDFDKSDDNGWYTTRAYWGTIQFPDVDGNGQADLCARGQSGILCSLVGPTAFGRVDFWTHEFRDEQGWLNDPSRWGTVQFPDVNGDGKSDVCGRDAAGIACGLSDGDAFGAVTVWQAAFADANGWNASPDRWATIQFPDLNGDGKADVCGRGPEGIVCGLSNGSTFAAPTVFAPAFKDAPFDSRADTWSTIQFPDLNGDGKADLCGRGPDGLHCGLGTGSTFAPVTLWQAELNDSGGWNRQSQAGTIQFVDLDDDGKADVCGRDAAGIVCALSNGTTGFSATTLWTADYSDALGWNAPQYWTSIAFPAAEGGNCRPRPETSSFARPAARLPF